MEIVEADCTSPGTVRTVNEDAHGFWQPETIEEKRARGAIAVLADGVGGQGHGEIASRLAVDEILRIFREARDGTEPTQIITQAVNAANLAVYDKNMESRGEMRMATTIAIAVLRNNKVTVGNVGDSRVYLVQKGLIKQLSTDHSYVGMQKQFGLITERDALASEQRSILTRSVGQEPTIRIDCNEATVTKGDYIVMCCDGLYTCVVDNEIIDIVCRVPPDEAAKQLVALAEKRGAQDNITVQVIRIDRVEAVSNYRGAPIYYEQTQPVAAGEFYPGQIVDNRFVIAEVISRSGMAVIYRATDRESSKEVAIKVPHMQYESDPGFFGRFQREEEIGRTLNHPFLLKFIQVERKSRPYIVTEYLKGYTLSHLMTTVRPLPEADALKIASRTCDALDHMHKLNIIHRDLKPANIMLCYDGTLRIMDFGIAKAIQGRRLTFTGFTPTMGTPDYMAPEQVKGKRGDARTDIYSVGAILYEMLAGASPFEGENPFVIMNARLIGDPVAPRKLNPLLSANAEEVILHAMARQPHDRYQTMAEMKKELDDIGAVIVTDRAARLQPPASSRPSMIRNMHTIILVMAIPIVTLIIFVIVLLLRLRAVSH
jgi:serine/threonine-protein kinase